MHGAEVSRYARDYEEGLMGKEEKMGDLQEIVTLLPTVAIYLILLVALYNMLIILIKLNYFI